MQSLLVDMVDVMHIEQFNGISASSNFKTITPKILYFGTPVALFSTHIFSQVFTYQYAVAPDGRFLVNDRQLADASPITLLLNWKP